MLTIFSRIPEAVNNIKTTPETNTPDKAVCHGMPHAPATVKAKKAFRPIPGAKAIGKFANNPINNVPTIAANTVATNTAPLSIPAIASKLGLTAKI